MKNRILNTTLGILCLISSAFAQNLYDVQRYSSNAFQSNARALAVGNAFGALGGNSVATSINPAGLAAYPVSEFSFSLGYNNAAIESNYLNSTYTNNKYSLNIPNLSLVLTENKGDKEVAKSDWIMSSFAITMNRRNTFNQSFLLNADNNESSILDRFAEEMDFLWFNDLKIDSTTYGGMAYFAYLVDPIYDNADSSISHFAPAISDLSTRSSRQRQSLKSRGNITDLNFSYASSYRGKVLIGGTLGVPILSYTEDGTYEEFNLNYLADNFNNLSIKHRIQDQGVGIIGQFGVILKPIHALRLGASIKTPTFYSVERTFKTWFVADTDQQQSSFDPKGYNYKYNIITPWNATLSAAFIIKNFGFVSVDYTYFDGSIATLKGIGSEGDLEYFDENVNISDALNQVSQLRMGAEYVFGPFSLRAGQTVSSNPFNSGYMPSDNMYAANTTSFGFGYREAKFYMDFGFQTSNRTTFFQPYSLSYADVDGAELNERTNSIVATFGFNF